MNTPVNHLLVCLFLASAGEMAPDLGLRRFPGRSFYHKVSLHMSISIDMLKSRVITTPVLSFRLLTPGRNFFSTGYPFGFSFENLSNSIPPNFYSPRLSRSSPFPCLIEQRILINCDFFFKNCLSSETITLSARPQIRQFN